MVSVEEAKRQVDELEEKVNRLGRQFSVHELREANILASRTLTVIKRMTGGSEDVQQWIGLLQRAVIVVRNLTTAFRLLYAASGPYGWAMLGVSLVSSAIITGDFVGSVFYGGMRGE